MKKHGQQAGFTLTEVIMVMTVMGFVLVGVGQMLLDTARTSFITSEKLDINADVRQFTLEMAENARAANHFFIYESFSPGSRNEPDDRIRDGGSGDLLVLIFQEPWPNLNSPEHYTRIVGYFRDADHGNPDSEGPVKRFEKRFHDPSLTVLPAWSSGPYPSAVTNTIEDMISDLSSGGNYRTIVQLSRGLSDGQLFYNYLDRSIMVKAQIIHGNMAKRITDTYNYTISPRG
ncbi:MAG: prepilin-type N-terminal cleavage/methylation domain-containing protein [Oceanipulchritudo sp.]